MDRKENNDLKYFLNSTKISEFNAKVDIIMQRSEIQSLLSDWDFLSQIDALGTFYYKLRQTNLIDSIETQFQFLSDFYAKCEQM